MYVLSPVVSVFEYSNAYAPFRGRQHMQNCECEAERDIPNVMNTVHFTCLQVSRWGMGSVVNVRIVISHMHRGVTFQ